MAKNGSPSEFYGQAALLLRERIGERLDIPAGGITEAVLRTQLEGRLPEKQAAALGEFFTEANAVRFGAEEASALPQALVKLRNNIAALEQLEAPVDEV